MKCIYRPLGVRGPGQEALSKGGIHLPLAGRGALGQSLRVAYPQGEGTAATPASVIPTQTRNSAEQEDRSQKPRRCWHPCH